MKIILSKQQKQLVFTIALFTTVSIVYISSSSTSRNTFSSAFPIKNFTKKAKNYTISSIIKKAKTTSNTIVVRGTSDDLGVYKRPNFLNNTYLFGKPHNDLEKSIQNDSLTFVLKNITEPLFMDFTPSGDNQFFSSKIYIQPNDTVQFEVKNKTLTFTGKNAAQNNLYSKLEAQTPKYSRFPYKGNLFLYKEDVRKIYEQKQQYFHEYMAKHEVSEEFVKVFEKHLKFEYYDNLVSPRSKAVSNGKFYVNDYDALPLLIEKEYANSENPFDMTSYLDNINITEFQDLAAMRHTHFLKNSLIVFIRHYFVKTDATPFSKEYFIAEKEFIEQNFKGEIRDYAIGRMIADYYHKGFAYGSQNINFMVKTIDDYIQSVKGKTTHIEVMETIREDITTYDFQLSESALNAKMVNYLGDTITLQDIFNRSNQRVKVVDFWASWCPPCIRQIKENKPFKDRLSVENNVEWIYLSIDMDKEKWLKKGKELSETLHFRNSYLLLKGKKSSLAKSLNVHQIPRYLIVDQKNKIVVNNAPSPNNTEAFEKIIDEIRPTSLIGYHE